MSLINIKKVDFEAKNIITDKAGNFIIIKLLINQKNVTILNTYAPNESLKIHEVKNNRPTNKNRPIHNYSQRFQYYSINNLEQIENQQGYRKFGNTISQLELLDIYRTLDPTTEE